MTRPGTPSPSRGGGRCVLNRPQVSVGPPHGTIAVTVRDGTTVLVLAGEVDVEVVTLFRRDRTPGRAAVTAIDAGDVTLLSASAVQLLLDIRWAAALADRPLALVRSNPHVDRVLHLLALTGAFPRGRGG